MTKFIEPTDGSGSLVLPSVPLLRQSLVQVPHAPGDESAMLRMLCLFNHYWYINILSIKSKQYIYIYIHIQILFILIIYMYCFTKKQFKIDRSDWFTHILFRQFAVGDRSVPSPCSLMISVIYFVGILTKKIWE